MKTEWLEIGSIVAPQGLEGEVRVYPNSDFPERFLEPGQRWIRRQEEEEPQPIELIKGRYVPGKSLYILQLAGVKNREQAEALRGCQLLVPESDRPELGKDEYHVLDLLGLEVFNQLTGEMVGTVVDILVAGNDLLQVQLKQSPETSISVEEPASSEAAEIHPSTRRGGRKRQREAKLSRRESPKPAAPATVLIPFVNDIVPVVDLANRRLEITPPLGLLESM